MGRFSGYAVTFRHLFRKPVTTQYPDEVREKPVRFHGRHVLNRYPDGMEKCIGCELCSGVCPADCIYVRGADNPPDDPVAPGERYGYVYEINFLRCIFCGLCVEACPTSAITMSNLFEFSVTDRTQAIFTKDDLLVAEDGAPRRKDGVEAEVTAGALEESGGWMRATSSAGDARFVGKPLWSPDAGVGLRPPESRGESSEARGDSPGED